MRQATVTVLVEGDRHLGRPQPHADRLQHHLRGVLPRLRDQSHAAERLAGDTAHPAVDVAEMAAEETVEDPGRQWRAGALMQGGHRTGLDRALPGPGPPV